MRIIQFLSAAFSFLLAIWMILYTHHMLPNGSFMELFPGYVIFPLMSLGWGAIALASAWRKR